jgi:hypothetical protein
MFRLTEQAADSSIKGDIFPVSQHGRKPLLPAVKFFQGLLL